MTTDNKTARDTETILMALDQISQTIEVMTSVVGRLRHYVQEDEKSAKSQLVADKRSSSARSRTLH